MVAVQSSAWGPTGHRVVGLIAERHLSNKARKNIEKVLGNETLAEVSTYMDFIRSDKKYRHLNNKHYCTIPDGKTYEEVGPAENGDVVVQINKLLKELKTKTFSEENEAFALKCLVHLIGDVHQPLHVGNGTDRGGNDVKVEYFWQPSNLHRVWDSGIIDQQKYSYTEYCDWIDHASEQEIEEWQNSPLMDWVKESVSYREQVYNIPDDRKLSYRYNYNNIDVVNLRLLQAGIRLAGVLNSIYG